MCRHRRAHIKFCRVFINKDDSEQIKQFYDIFIFKFTNLSRDANMKLMICDLLSYDITYTGFQISGGNEVL
jgi:hypothetical protein